MHVWRSADDLAQCRRFEFAVRRTGIGEFAVAPGDAGVVQALIGEVGSNVAGNAVGFASEETEAGLLLGRERRAVAVDETVVARIAGKDGPDEAGQCTGDFRRRKAGAGGGFDERQVHLVGIFDGLQDLLFERGRPAIPEEQPSVAAIDEGRRVAAPLTPKDADRDRAPVRVGALGIVARCAGHRSIARKAAVEEQPPPQLDLLRGKRVLLRHRQIQIQPKRNRDRRQQQHHLPPARGRKFSNAQISEVWAVVVSVTVYARCFPSGAMEIGALKGMRALCSTSIFCAAPPLSGMRQSSFACEESAMRLTANTHCMPGPHATKFKMAPRRWLVRSVSGTADGVAIKVRGMPPAAGISSKTLELVARSTPAVQIHLLSGDRFTVPNASPRAISFSSSEAKLRLINTTSCPSSTRR